jgi:hypothetical protein
MSGLRASASATIPGWTDLTTRRRQDLIGAMTKVCAVAGLPPETLLLNPDRLRAMVLTRSPAAWGLKAVSKSNVLSRLRYVLGRLGVIDRTKTAPSPAWGALRDRADDRGQRSLAALIGFCSRRAIEPAQLTDTVLDEFELWLTARTLQAEPRSVRTVARRAWNRAVKEIDGWPPIHLSLQSRRGQLLLPFTAFPDCFQADVAAYRDKLTGHDLEMLFGVPADTDDPFEPPAAVKPHSLMTVETKLQHIKMVANALHRTGGTARGHRQPGEPGDAARASQSHHDAPTWRAAKKTRTPGLGHAVESLRQIAEHHAGCTPADVKAIADWGKKVRPSYNSMTARNRTLLAKITVPATLRELLALPC